MEQMWAEGHVVIEKKNKHTPNVSSNGSYFAKEGINHSGLLFFLSLYK